jgi:TolB-like protein
MVTPAMVHAFAVLAALALLPGVSSRDSTPVASPGARPAGTAGAVIIPSGWRADGRTRQGQHPAAGQTLCILDFNRLGDDPSADWLRRGLADVMITTMNRLSRFQIVDRRHLVELLREHGLANGGLLDLDAGVDRARLAGAELLLLGNFVHQGDIATVQVRLIRVADQQPLAMATWSGDPGAILRSPTPLAHDLLRSLDEAIAPASLEGIEKLIPRSIDTAEAFYRGMEAFDEGMYPVALAHYLDAAAGAPGFLRAHLAVIDLYTFLERPEHAVVFAAAAAGHLEAADLEDALRLYFTAAELASASLGNGAAAIAYWNEIVTLAEAHEERTHEAAATKDFVREKALELYASGRFEGVADILRTPEIRYRIWSRGIDDQAGEMDPLGAYRNVVRDRAWTKEPVPAPSVFMWKSRAQLHLARAHAHQGDVRAAVRTYDAILEDYAFLSGVPVPAGNETVAWGRDVELEALFMILRHYSSRGELLRDESRMVVLDAESRARFARDFSDPEPDRRARAWSRRADGGHEYFDFAAPAGYRIDRAIVRIGVGGVTKLSFHVPDPKGWPPRYDFSRLLERYTFYAGEHEQVVELPPGTEFFSASVLWGPRWLDNPVEWLRWEIAGGGSSDDIDALAIEFVLSATQPATTGGGGTAEAGSTGAATTAGSTGTTTASIAGAPLPSRDADALVVEHFATRFGWEGATVLRRNDAIAYTGVPRRDVVAMDWIAYAQDGDIHILQRDRPEVRVDLPVTINSRDDERDPWLVPTHEGEIAILFTRGGDDPEHFVARSRDMVGWRTPQRIEFDQPEGPAPGAGRIGRSRQTINVVALPVGYLMVAGGGFARYSEDLRHWSVPQRLFEHDGEEAVVVKTADGRIWVIGTSFVDEEIAAGAARDPWVGYFRTADGRTFKKAAAIEVTSSLDGVHWSPRRRVLVDRETSALWAFPISRSQIGVAASYNNLFLRWAASVGPERFVSVESPVRLLLENRNVRFFAADNRIVCLRPVRDFVEEEGVALLMQSRELYERLGQ